MSERVYLSLDVGSAKVTAVIGERAADRVLDVIGEGSVASEGMKRGAVINLEKTSAAVRAAVRAAERVAGVQTMGAWLSVGGPQIKSKKSHGLAAIRRGHTITPEDAERAVEQAKTYPLEDGEELLHVVPLEYRVDGQEGIHDPVGMTGVRLEVDVLLVTAPAGPLANLRRAVEGAGVTINGLVAAPLASGLGVLTPEEMEMNVLVLDLGAGTTGVGLFREGRLAFAETLPVGQELVSSDIAKLLKIPFEEAERFKKKYGAALPEFADPELVLEISQEGRAEAAVAAPELARIIRPRLREIYALARKAVEEKVGALQVVADKVVLTGGGALLKGADELARRDFDLPVRLGRPRGVDGLADIVASPTHATAVGLLHYAEQHAPSPAAAGRLRLPRFSREEKPAPTGPSEPLWERIKNVLKDLF